MRSTGRVKFFADDRGFGFITPDDGGPDVFVHRKDLEPNCRIDGELTLLADQRVAFDVVDTPRGPKAANVKDLVSQRAL